MKKFLRRCLKKIFGIPYNLRSGRWTTTTEAIDRLYSARPDVRKIALEKEKEYRMNFERLQRPNRLKDEAKTLEKAVKSNKLK